MKGRKWLDKLNEKELAEFYDLERATVLLDGEHYYAGPGDGKRVLQVEEWIQRGITLSVITTDDASDIEGAKFWPKE